MNLVTVLHFTNLFFGGLLAGIEVAVRYGVGAPPPEMSDQAQIQVRQQAVLRLRVLVPAFFVPTALSAIAIAIADGRSRGLWFRCTGSALLLFWIGLRALTTVPVNKATVAWVASAPPKDWKAIIERVERFHIVGVWVTILVFNCFLAAVTVARPT